MNHPAEAAPRFSPHPIPLASMPIAVLMQRRLLQHRWADEAWAAVAVLRDEAGAASAGVRELSRGEQGETYLVGGLKLELFLDENEGYHENLTAAAPKVFVLWRMEAGRAMPQRASVSYVDGTRMFDSGENADGVPMGPEIHAWLADYLRRHYVPRPPGGEARHGKRRQDGAGR